MRNKGIFHWLTGWSDFFFTFGEVLLPEVGLYRLARWIAERHYAGVGSYHRAGAKELVLAGISGREGNLKAAEDYYRDAASLRPGEPDPYLLWGTLYERNGQRDRAVWAYERALPLAQDEPALILELRRRLATLRTTLSRD
jgi:tetratricopeptide (TPR) repeat protein